MVIKSLSYAIYSLLTDDWSDWIMTRFLWFDHARIVLGLFERNAKESVEQLMSVVHLFWSNQDKRFSNTDTYTKERKTSKNREIHGDNEQRRCKRQKQTKKKKRRKWQETQKKICSVVLNLHCVFKACIQFCFISCVVLWREFSWIWKINIIRRFLSRYYWE